MNAIPGRPLVPCLPQADLDDHVAVVEVLIQEGFRAFGVPAQGDALASLVHMFGSRAEFWATRVATADDVARAVEAGAARLLGDDSNPGMIEAAASHGVGLWATAMTATEIRLVLSRDVAGALLWPADVVGHGFAARLGEIGLGDKVIPMGGVGAYAAGEWLTAGSPAACVDNALLGDAYQGGSLGKLRDRCGSFIAVQQRHAETDDDSSED